MLVSRNLHWKSSEVSIKTRSPLASLSFKCQATNHTIVKWSIAKEEDFSWNNFHQTLRTIPSSNNSNPKTFFGSCKIVHYEIITVKI